MATTPGPVVIKVGGSTLEDIGALASLWETLARVSAVTPLVLVHGGGKAVDALIKKLGWTVERREGLRVTPPEQMDVIAGVLAGSVNKALVGAINRAAFALAQGACPSNPAERATAQVRASARLAVGLCLGDGAMVECRRMTKTPGGTPVDLGRVGEVADGDARVVRSLLRDGFLPVVSSVGIDAEGGLLNVNADDAAAALAKAVGASALVLLTDVPGVKGANGTVKPELNAADIEAMIAAGEITGGMIPKVRSAMAAARSTGAGVVILSGETPEALISYLSGRPAGTTIRA